jgi:hypothetical protein
MAGRLPAIGRAAARVLAVLKVEPAKSGSGCPDPERPPSDERGVMHDSKRIEIEGRGPQDLRIVEGTNDDNTNYMILC